MNKKPNNEATTKEKIVDGQDMNYLRNMNKKGITVGDILRLVDTGNSITITRKIEDNKTGCTSSIYSEASETVSSMDAFVNKYGWNALDKLIVEEIFADPSEENRIHIVCKTEVIW